MMDSFRVDFFIVGAQKCGTTTLAEALNKHSQICFSSVKEPFHFNRINKWSDNIQNYHRLFKPNQLQLCGEASTHYSFLPYYPNTIENIYSYNPNSKIIYIVRNPVDRISSLLSFKQYRHELRYKDLLTEISHNYEYLSPGRYAMQITPYIEKFGTENVLILFMEDLKYRFEYVMKELTSFLGIDNQLLTIKDSIQANASGEIRYSSKGFQRFLSLPLIKQVNEGLNTEVKKLVKKKFYKMNVRIKLPVDVQNSLKQYYHNDNEWLSDLVNRPLNW